MIEINLRSYTPKEICEIIATHFITYLILRKLGIYYLIAFIFARLTLLNMGKSEQDKKEVPFVNVLIDLSTEIAIYNLGWLYIIPFACVWLITTNVPNPDPVTYYTNQMYVALSVVVIITTLHWVQ